MESTLSYVITYMAIYFGFCPECIFNPFDISTLVDDFFLAKRVYMGCMVFVYGRKTLVNLIELDMLDFDVILRKNCLILYKFSNYLGKSLARGT